jgi:hypothetical protein
MGFGVWRLASGVWGGKRKPSVNRQMTVINTHFCPRGRGHSGGGATDSKWRTIFHNGH